MIIKLILICSSNPFFNFSIKMKNEKWIVRKWKSNEGIKNSKKESIKHENSSQFY